MSQLNTLTRADSAVGAASAAVDLVAVDLVAVEAAPPVQAPVRSSLARMGSGAGRLAKRGASRGLVSIEWALVIIAGAALAGILITAFGPSGPMHDTIIRFIQTVIQRALDSM